MDGLLLWIAQMRLKGTDKRNVEEQLRCHTAYWPIGRRRTLTMVWSGDAATTAAVSVACCCRTVDFFSTKILIMCETKQIFSVSFFRSLFRSISFADTLLLFLCLVCALSHFSFSFFSQLLIWCHVCLLLSVWKIHIYITAKRMTWIEMEKDRELQSKSESDWLKESKKKK